MTTPSEPTSEPSENERSGEMVKLLMSQLGNRRGSLREEPTGERLVTWEPTDEPAGESMGVSSGEPSGTIYLKNPRANLLGSQPERPRVNQLARNEDKCEEMVEYGRRV
jgi:hypothetical protein